MNDIRRTILWVIFGFSMVLLWDQWQLFNGQKATFFPSPAPATAVAPGAKPADAAAVPGGQPGTNAVPAPVQASGAAPAAPGALPATTPSATKERVVVTTDVLSLTFDTEGGTVVHSSFLKHMDMTDKASGFVLLDQSAARVYVAQSGLIAGAAGGSFPTHKTLMTAGRWRPQTGQDLHPQTWCLRHRRAPRCGQHRRQRGVAPAVSAACT
jgi:YidC/Oxa1 family membrane protein insertase